MVKEKIEAILNEAAKVIPEDIEGLKSDIESNLRASLNATFSKMELVTREEFDVQTALLQRTRSKLDGLQKAIEKLENSN